MTIDIINVKYAIKLSHIAFIYGEIMGLHVCKDCGKEISTRAASCPGCGAPNEFNEISSVSNAGIDTFDTDAKRPPPKKVHVITFAAVAMVGLGLYAYLSHPNDKTVQDYVDARQEVQHSIVDKQSEATTARLKQLDIDSQLKFEASRQNANPDQPAKNVQAAAFTVSASQLISDYMENEVAADLKYKDKRFKVTGTIQSINKDFTDSIYVSLLGSESFRHVKADGFTVDQAAAFKKGEALTITCTGEGLILKSPILRECIVNE